MDCLRYIGNKECDDPFLNKSANELIVTVETSPAFRYGYVYPLYCHHDDEIRQWWGDYAGILDILNRCNKIKLIHGSVSQVKMFKCELILANINTNVLLNELDLYYKFLVLNGILILSGFLVKDYIKIYNKASECGFTFVHKKEENKWNCIVLRKSI
mgnify:CR=1 FL=1